MRSWVDKADPTPSSSLVYRTSDGGEVIIRAEMVTDMPGALIELSPFPRGGQRTLINADEAEALARRLLRMAERSRTVL